MEQDTIQPLPVVEKKKRGRKPKPKPENVEPHVPKKRGRKPKGGKIINNPLEKSKESEYITENVILHLKCNTEDLNNGDISNNIGTIDDNNLTFHVLNENNDDTSFQEYDDDNNNLKEEFTNSVVPTTDSVKHISNKIIELQKNFYFNDIQNNNSSCFWCTCDFDHSCIHIPKYKLNDKYHVYGCFCTPECAVAYLMKEQIDSSQKYERYQLINFLYNDIYNININIKPAPDPHYLLEKFMGNLTINEYRQLLRQDRLFIVVDKPITRILPEIYEETDISSTQFEILQPKTSFQVKKGNNNKLSFF